MILETNGTISPVNISGEELVLYRTEIVPSYNENISTPDGSYTYRAQRDERSGLLCVYVPERVRETIAQKIAQEMKSNKDIADSINK